MTQKIDPGLFARLMRMSPEPRRDLLEFIGQTPVDPDHIILRSVEGKILPPDDTVPPEN